MGALRPKLPCALVECASRKCDARIGMCVHVSVPLMHSRSRCCVSCVAPAVGILAVVKSHVATVGASDHSHRSSCQRSSCDKLALRHTKASPAVQREASQSKSSCGAHVRGTFCCFSPSLPLSLFGTGRNVWKEGGMYGWMDGWREGGGDSLLFVCLSLSLSLSPSIWRVC